MSLKTQDNELIVLPVCSVCLHISDIVYIWILHLIDNLYCFVYLATLYNNFPLDKYSFILSAVLCFFRINPVTPNQ